MRNSSIQSGALHVAPQFHRAFRELGIDADAVFSHEQIIAWRTLVDRENCTLDVVMRDGSSTRFHVKRYAPTRGRTPAELELAGHRLLVDAGIPTAELVAWGVLRDRRSFIIFEDLDGYEAGDRIIENGLPFAEILESSADLAAALHNANLHHRDLYVCHFFARSTDDGIDLRLIDAARVRIMPRLTRARWITKDVAQFWYSTLELPVTDEQRDKWLARYAQQRRLDSMDSLQRAVIRKSRVIERHDRSLRRKQPTRNIPIPER